MPLGPTNYYHPHQSARIPDACPQHLTGHARPDGKRKVRQAAAPERKSTRLEELLPCPVQAKTSATAARDALHVYQIWLALRGEGKPTCSLSALADAVGVERHWFSRKLKEWCQRNGDLSRKHGSGRPSTVTPEMVDVLSEWAEKKQWRFSNTCAADALSSHGWTEGKLKLWLENRWTVECL